MVTKDNAGKIVSRIDNIPLYLHAYAYHLNMRLERILPNDLLTIADSLHLKGVKIHVLDGERYSLSNMNDAQLAGFADKAKALQLDIHIETSASDATDHQSGRDCRFKNRSDFRSFFIRVMKAICLT